MMTQHETAQSEATTPYAGGFGWREDLKYTDPVDGENVVWILEDWVKLDRSARGRVLKAFRPNPTSYPNLYIVPEQFVSGPTDRPDSTEVGRLGTDERKTEWLQDMVGLLKQDDVGDGSRLLGSVGRDIERIPSLDQVRDGSWRPGDGHYTVCDARGEEVLPRRRIGISLIMGPSQADTKWGRVNTNRLFKDRVWDRIANRSIVTFDPRVVLRLGPRLVNGELVYRNTFQYPAQALAHELIHQNAVLLGIQLRNDTGLATSTQDGFTIFEPDSYDYKPGNPYNPQDGDKWRMVSAEEASVTTVSGRSRANALQPRRDSCEAAKHDLDTFEKLVRLGDFGKDGQKIKDHLIEQVSKRLQRQQSECFTEDVISLDILTAPRWAGGLGLSRDEALEHIRCTYVDLERDSGILEQHYYWTDNPVEPQRGTISRTSIEIGGCAHSFLVDQKTVQNGICIPELTEEKPPLKREFKPAPWEEIQESARFQVAWLDERPNKQAAWTEFKPTVKEAWFEPGSVFHGFRESVRPLNEAMGATFEAVGYYSWLKGLAEAFSDDMDLLSSVTAVVGIVPVVGNLMGIFDGAVHGNWEEVALSGVGLVAILAGQAVPVVGEVIDVALGLYMVVSELVNLIEGMFKKQPSDGEAIAEMRTLREEAWWEAVAQQSDTVIIPQMEQAWRRYEQGLLSSFAQTLAMLDLKAEQVKNQTGLSEAEKKKVEAETASTREHLWSRFGSFLVDAAVSFQTQMQNTLWQLLTNQGNFEAFSKEVADRCASNRYKFWYDKCWTSGADGCWPLDDACCGEAAANAQQHAADQMAPAVKDLAPTEFPQRIYDLFDKDGRFFPRVLPPNPLPAPHLLEATWIGVEGNSETMRWVPPKTLPRALVAKIRFESRADGGLRGEAPCAAGRMEDSAGIAPGYVETSFVTPDIPECPQVEGPDRHVDRRWRGPVTSFKYIKGPEDVSFRCDLDETPHNEGYGSIVGGYVIVSEETGWAIDVARDAPSVGAPVVQGPPSGEASQTWRVSFEDYHVLHDKYDCWGVSAVVNVKSGLSLGSKGGQLAEGDKLAQQDTSVDQQRWFPELAEPASGAKNGFILRGVGRNTCVTSGYDFMGIGDNQLYLSKPEAATKQRWRFVPAGTVLPVPGRYYTIVNDWNGLAVELRDPSLPVLTEADPSSPTQVFQLKYANPGLPLAGGVHLWSPFHRKPVGLQGSLLESKATFRPTWGGTWKIADPSGKMLDVPNQTRAPGALLVLADEDVQSRSQAWRLYEVGVRDFAGVGATQRYAVTSPGTGFAATVKDNDARDGQPVQLEIFAGKISQLWTLRGDSDQGCVVDCVGTGGKLGVKDGSQADSAAAVQHQSAEPAQSDKWRLVPTPGGAWAVVNTGSGKVLDTEKTSSTGAALAQRGFNGTANQLWAITPVSSPKGPVGLFPVV